MTGFDRSRAQRMAALTHANEVRSARARVKRRIKAAEPAQAIATVIDLAATPPPFMESMKIGDLLIVTPTIGRVKRDRLLHHARVSPSKTIGGLSSRQRAEIIAGLNRRRTHYEKAVA